MEFNQNLINENYLSITDICKHCNGKYFAFEYNKNKEFSNCCHQGRENKRLYYNSQYWLH